MGLWHSVQSMFIKIVPRSQICGEGTKKVSNVDCLVLVGYLKTRFEPSVSSFMYISRVLKSKPRNIGTVPGDGVFFPSTQRYYRRLFLLFNIT
jgi:hypothetical protein